MKPSDLIDGFNFFNETPILLLDKFINTLYYFTSRQIEESLWLLYIINLGESLYIFGGETDW